MSVHCPEQLDKAIQKRLCAMLCASAASASFASSTDAQRQHLGIRFMHPAEAPDEGAFWVELKEDRRPLIDRLIRDRTTVEVSFNLDDARVYFDTAILRKRRRYWARKLVLLRFPERLSVVEQRGSARNFVPDDVDIYAKIFRASGPGSEEPLVSWRLFDLSAGGAGVICPRDPRLLALKAGEPLHVIVTFGDKGVPLAATHRYAQVLSTSSLRLGIKFNEFQPRVVQEEFGRLLARLTELRTTRHIMQTVRRS